MNLAAPRYLKALTIIFLISLASCASQSSQMGDYYHPPIEPPPKNLARIYIFNPHNPKLQDDSAPVIWINKEKLAKLQNGTYTRILLKPGSYVIHSEKETWFDRDWHIKHSITVSAGHDYYYGLEHKIEHRNRLIPVDDVITIKSAPQTKTLKLRKYSPLEAAAVMSDTRLITPLN